MIVINIKQKRKPRFYSEEIRDDWTEMYLDGHSSVKIGEKYDCGSSIIISELRRRGIEPRSNSVNSKRYSIEREDYFESIDTEGKAYFLGFIYADGYITSKRKGEGSQAVGISISTKDRYLLEYFKKEISSTHPIKEYKVLSGYKPGAEYSRLLFRNQKMVDDLKDKGVVENKTDICEFPTSKLPNHLIRHFIRGYMDGDGSIIKKVSKSKLRYEYSVGWTGTENMLSSIIEYLASEGLVFTTAKFEKRESHHVVSSIHYGGNYQAERILEHLYKDSNFFLKRKHCRFIELKNQNKS